MTTTPTPAAGDVEQAALDALCERGITSLDDALAMADVLVSDDHDCDPGLLLDFGCDVIGRLRDAVLRARLRAPAADLAAIGARAAAAVDAIIADGSDRRGVLGLDSCDDDIRDEIVATWRAAVAREIVAAVVENTGACNSHAVALLAAERERHAAEVAGARAAALREGLLRGLALAQEHAGPYIDDDMGAPGIDWTDAVAAVGDASIAALATKGAPDV